MTLVEYLSNHYGECKLGIKKCQCLRTQWFGTLCPHWEPLGAKNWEELREYQTNRLREEKEKAGDRPEVDQREP